MHLFLITVQWFHLIILKLSMVGQFLPRNSANTAHQSFLASPRPRKPAAKHLSAQHCVFWNSPWRNHIILQSYQQHMRVPVFSQAHQQCIVKLFKFLLPINEKLLLSVVFCIAQRYLYSFLSFLVILSVFLIIFFIL